MSKTDSDEGGAPGTQRRGVAHLNVQIGFESKLSLWLAAGGASSVLLALLVGVTVVVVELARRQLAHSNLDQRAPPDHLEDEEDGKLQDEEGRQSVHVPAPRHNQPCGPNGGVTAPYDEAEEDAAGAPPSDDEHHQQRPVQRVALQCRETVLRLDEHFAEVHEDVRQILLEDDSDSDAVGVAPVGAREQQNRQHVVDHHHPEVPARLVHHRALNEGLAVPRNLSKEEGLEGGFFVSTVRVPDPARVHTLGSQDRPILVQHDVESPDPEQNVRQHVPTILAHLHHIGIFHFLLLQLLQTQSFPL
mmetsp:Transcript_30423/g.61693  ORF Transcript_30423/g.61693 Transcript_30423/m.61693 type:complete len:303 (+) Transcript_30423:120-1028(+)